MQILKLKKTSCYQKLRLCLQNRKRALLEALKEVGADASATG
ncbi:MAG: hypothetical protein QXK86_06525 [Candidatus Bathyarchaeia archaeon]